MISYDYIREIVLCDEIWKYYIEDDVYEYTTEGMHTYPHQPLRILYEKVNNNWAHFTIYTSGYEEWNYYDSIDLVEEFPHYFYFVTIKTNFNPFITSYVGRTK